MRSLGAMPVPSFRPFRARRVAGPLAGVLLAGGLLAGGLLAGCGPAATPGPVARGYLADWAARDWPAMRHLVAGPPADFAAVNAAALADLGVSRARYARTGRLRVRGAAASEPVAEELSLPGIGVVDVPTRLRLTEQSGKWLVRWTPATIATGLVPGGRLSLTVAWPARAAILGAGGVPLTTQAPLVTIGVEGQRIKHNAAALTRALVAAGAPAAQVRSALAGARKEPTWFEPVFTVTAARYRQLKAALYPLPGTVFQNTSARSAITPGLAAHVVGSVGPVTAQELKALGPPYTAQSLVGQTGLEQADQQQLAGRPGASVSVLSPAGKQIGAVGSIPPKPGTPVRTTIEPRVQRAAEAALAHLRKAGQQKHAALIAVDARTGDVLASVSDPAGDDFDQALDGAFPPGSSFKVITSTALIEHGLSPASRASCPPTVTVDGEVFHNAEGTAPISDLLHAFAESCNTAFIGLATRHLSAAEFPATARTYRLGITPRIGLAAFGGAVPRPTDLADLAATTIGQGQVLVSPLAMVTVAAAVDTGTVRAPMLVDGAPDEGVSTTRLPAAVVTDLHQMMAQVVATGTAAHRGLPAGTYAKTGTAQYGHGHPLPTDAWLIGFRGNIAFAMVTVNGGEGGPTDGPIVARFLDALGR
jgi:transpeptidase family protein/penicillin-binding protein